MSLPLAPDRATLSNRISLLLSQRATLIKSLTPASTSPSSRPSRRHADPEDDEGDFLKGNRPNEGVGYVPTKDAGSRVLSKERGVLLGKRKAREGKGGKWKAEEAEEDEEPGRSGLGRRKKARREDTSTTTIPDGDETTNGGEANDTTGSDGDGMTPREEMSNTTTTPDGDEIAGREINAIPQEGEERGREKELVIRTAETKDPANQAAASKKKKKNKKKNKKKKKQA